MKKIVLISNRPWNHITYLHKLCEEIECEVETILSGQYCFSDMFNSNTYDFFSNEFYEKLQKEFPNANIIHHNMEKFYEQAITYINDENALVLAEVENEQDCVFKFLKYTINNYERVNNILCLALYIDSVSLCLKSFEKKLAVIIPNETMNSQIIFHENAKDYLLLKKELTK